VDRAIGPPLRPAAIAIGSNLGDRYAAFDFALDRLSGILIDPVASTFVETEAEDRDGNILTTQPLYLNGVVTGLTALEPHALHAELQGIEREHGRERLYQGAPRTLDLDLVLLGDVIVDEPDLQVPHPRFRLRFFVLGPLAEIAPAMRDPVTGSTVIELLRALLRDE
jgi:2-amino-4-hydroxy-6-hydroxymethyldihydropteridine diphosphokinase